MRGYCALRQFGMRLEPRGVEPMDGEAHDGRGGEWQRRPHVKLLHRKADEQGARERPDDRADASEAELPARSVGAERRRIEHCADHVDADLDPEHDEAGEECRGQQGRFRGHAGKADRADHRDREHEEKRDAEEAMPLQPPAKTQCADGAADLQECAASAAVVGGSLAAVSSVGVQPDRKK